MFSFKPWRPQKGKFRNGITTGNVERSKSETVSSQRRAWQVRQDENILSFLES